MTGVEPSEYIGSDGIVFDGDSDGTDVTYSPLSSQLSLTYGDDYMVDGEIITNFPLNSIVIKKVSAVTGELLAGAAFELRQVTGDISGSSGTIIGRYVTNHSGIIVITELEAGTGYIIEEVLAPQNYLLSENSSQQAWLKGDGTSVVELTFSNYPYGHILVTKVDLVTGKPLAGARFKVTDGTGAVAGSTNGIFTTDVNGEFLVSNLKTGSYVVTEIETPANYEINTAPQTVHVGNDGKTYTISFSNNPYGCLLITKVDAQTNKPLANARFRVTDSSGAVLGNTNGAYITNENGEVLIPNVKSGAYVVREIEAPEYYVVDTTPQTINVYADGKVYKVSFKNQPTGTLIIKKYDYISKEPLADAEFKVTTSGGDVVGNSNGIYKTDVNGTITI